MTEDDRLVEGLLARDPGAWETLLARHVGLIEAACRRAQRQAGSAGRAVPLADLCAEVHRALLEGDALRAFRPGASLAAYLHVFARHRAVEQLRRQAPGGIPWLKPAAAEADPSALVLAAERLERLRRALSGLPAREAEAIRLFHLEELDYRGISARMGIPEDQVGVLLHRARKRLRANLGEEFAESP